MKQGWLLALTIAISFIGSVLYTLGPTSIAHQPLSMLRIGVSPDERQGVLQERYAPLIKYISTYTGLEAHLVTPSSHQELVELFRTNKVDLAYFSGLAFTQVISKQQAKPLVMRDIDNHFSSSFIVPYHCTARSLLDLRKQRFLFGGRLSTSGHLMPRHYMNADFTIKPESFFSRVSYTESHDKTAYDVRDGIADIGVLDSKILANMLEDGRIREKQLRVLWETPPYTDYVWAVQGHLNQHLTDQLRDAFLSLSIGSPDHGSILQSLNAHYYLPAGRNDFRLLSNIAHDYNLLDQINDDR